jgi:chitinase
MYVNPYSYPPVTQISQNVKAIISLGGWGGSQYFSSLFATSARRKYFAHVLMKFVSKHGLDGIEFECV